MDCSMPSFPVFHFAQTPVDWVGDATQPSHLCCSLLLPSIFPSIRVFSSELALRIRWLKYWSFSPSSEYSGLISFRIDWLISSQFKGLSGVFSNTPVESIIAAFFMVQGSGCSLVVHSSHYTWEKGINRKLETKCVNVYMRFRLCLHHLAHWVQFEAQVQSVFLITFFNHLQNLAVAFT